MAITALASWIGISITPLRLLKNNDFNSQDMVVTAISLGVFLIISWLDFDSKRIKKAF